MSVIEGALTANRAAVEEMIARAERSASEWTTPRAPGKWSPAQVVEHVARSLEQSANVLAERPSLFPKVPFFVRPLTRVFFRRIVRSGSFPNARTNPAMNPTTGPATPAEGERRLRDACDSFEREARAKIGQSPTMRSSIFGSIPVNDYVRFMELHTRHHTAQITAS